MGMCGGELKSWIERLHEESNGLLRRYQEECYLCEICLVRMETIVKSIRYELEKEKEYKKDSPAE